MIVSTVRDIPLFHSYTKESQAARLFRWTILAGQFGWTIHNKEKTYIDPRRIRLSQLYALNTRRNAHICGSLPATESFFRSMEPSDRFHSQSESHTVDFEPVPHFQLTLILNIRASRNLLRSNLYESQSCLSSSPASSCSG